jgi:hypothetical protein
LTEIATRTVPTPTIDGSVPITITDATVQGWPKIAAALGTLRVAAEAAGGEVIVADGSGHAAPTEDEVGPNVRWESHPGESIFQLRYRTYRAARGELIASTEDHVHVPADWATRMIDAHRRNPEAAAIGGSILNGATDTIMDWASFLVVQGAFAAPMRSGQTKRLVGVANVSYKRSALEASLEASHGHEGMGAMDALDQRDLARDGAILLNDDTIRVSHVQPLGFRGTTVIHFHAGRTVSGFRRKRMDPIQVARILAAPFIPPIRYVLTTARLARKGYGSLLVRCAPAMLWLFYMQGVGQTLGYLAGEGDSPRKVL